MICERCGNSHDGSYGSGRFCSPSCARSFSTSKNRSEINKKVSRSMKGYRTILGGKIKLCDYGCGQEGKFQFKNGKWCCSKNTSSCPNIKKINSLKPRNKPKIFHDNFGESCRKGQIRYHKNNNKLIIKSIPFEKWPLRLIREQLFLENGNKCQECGFEYTDPKTGKGPFQIHHKDGNKNNWKRENLQILCLNCHWMTPNFAFKGRHHTRETKKILSERAKNHYLKKQMLLRSDAAAAE